MKTPRGAKKLKAHRWKAEKYGHYVEERWVAERLFDVETFDGLILDPCCGFGRIPIAAKAAGYDVIGRDLVHRGYGDPRDCADFLDTDGRWPNIIANPPFHIIEEFTTHALKIARRKVALIWLWQRLPAATWLSDTPLARIYALNPRPSMPPGHVVKWYEKRGERPKGGTKDFCWLVFDHRYRGHPQTRWLKRDPDNE